MAMPNRAVMVCAALIAIVTLARGDSTLHRGDYAAAFAEIHSTVARHFFDAQLRGLDWAAVGDKFAEMAKDAGSLDQFSRVINEMLAHLETSHTHLYTSRDPAYYQLLSIFNPEPSPYPGIGIFVTERGEGTFISGVIEGTPGADAGLRVGDRIVAVNDRPFHPIGSFEGRVGLPTEITVQRTRDPSDPAMITVTPAMLEPRAMFENAIRKSVRIIQGPTRRIGYIRMWTYAGEQYREALKDEIGKPPLNEADALIIDLRDGWGGANPEDINIFNHQVATLTYIGRDDSNRTIDRSWRKPVALLVNEGTRSGKEIIAHSFQRHKIGPVVGARTAGAVVGGRPFPIGADMLLYLATADVRVDGERLEGVGITPDVEVAFELPFANGVDPQMDAAIAILSP